MTVCLPARLWCWPLVAGVMFALGIPASSARAGAPLIDCNENGIADELDIAQGTSSDCNANAIPDECDVVADMLLAELNLAWGGDGPHFPVSIHGEIAAFGSYLDDGAFEDSGAVHVYQRSGPTWQFVATLRPEMPLPGSEFGSAVALEGNTLIATAPFESSQTGAAYVFVREGDEWTQQAKLTPNDAATFKRFGGSVALSGDLALIGAPGDNEGGSGTGGAVYIFSRNGESWTQQAKFRGLDTISGDEFGCSVGIDGDTAVVGARDHGDGAAYVFTRDAGTWTQRAKLTDAYDPGATFGSSVSVSGDTVLVGADRWGRPSSVYVFVGAGDTWEKHARFDCAVGLMTVAVDGHRAIACGWAPNYPDSQSLVLERRDGIWFEKARVPLAGPVSLDGDLALVGPRLLDLSVRDCNANGIPDECEPDCNLNDIADECDLSRNRAPVRPTSDHYSGDGFGLAAAIDGRTFVVGAYLDTEAADHSGAAYIFTREALGWHRQAKMLGQQYQQLGFTVSINGDTALINGGGIRVYVRDDQQWLHEATFTANDLAIFDEFGRTIDLSGETAVVGAWGDDDDGAASGSAYVFVRSPWVPGTWFQHTKLTANDAISTDVFGWSVSIDGDTIAVGAPRYYSDDPETGAVYIFVRKAGIWTEQATLVPDDGAPADKFGTAVSVHGDTVLVGAIGHDLPATAAGAAYVFVRSGSVWSQQAKLTPADAAAGDIFGTSLALHGDAAVVSAHRHDAGFSNAGAVYVFRRQGGVWDQQEKILSPAPRANGNFGTSLSFDGHTLAVGQCDSGLCVVGSRTSVYVMPLHGDDCNDNAVPDECDIAAGTSLDCDGNGIPDECEFDRDGDGVIDACDVCPAVYDPAQADCDADGRGDACSLLDQAEMWVNVAPAEAPMPGDQPLAHDLHFGHAVTMSGFTLGFAGSGSGSTVATVTFYANNADNTLRPPNNVLLARPYPLVGGAGIELRDTVNPPMTLPQDVWLEVRFSDPAFGWSTVAFDPLVGTTSGLAYNRLTDTTTSARFRARIIGTPLDCDADGVPDHCNIAAGALPDADANGVPDACILQGAPGDIDGDGDVDLNDFITFAVCFGGPNVSTPPVDCASAEFADADLDNDGDVDLSDFVLFATSFTG